MVCLSSDYFVLFTVILSETSSVCVYAIAVFRRIRRHNLRRFRSRVCQHGVWPASSVVNKFRVKFSVACFTKYELSDKKQESPTIGGAVRNAMSFIPERLYCIMLSITCSENVYARLCIYLYVRYEHDNNMQIAICVMRSRQQVHSDLIFWVNETKMSNSLHKGR